jgi:hypothetical protein
LFRCFTFIFICHIVRHMLGLGSSRPNLIHSMKGSSYVRAMNDLAELANFHHCVYRYFPYPSI